MRSTRILHVLVILLILPGAEATAQDSGSIASWGLVTIAPPDHVYDVVEVAMEDHLVARRADGTLVAWGQNTLYVEGPQCMIPDPNWDFIDIAVTDRASFGLKPDGVIRRWGNDQGSWAWLPHPNEDFTAIFAGRRLLVARRTDGSLAFDGSLGSRDAVPAPNLDFTSVAIGDDFVVGLRSSTSVVVWGDLEGRDALLPPETNAGFVKVVAGTRHWIGLRDDGTIVERGYKAYEVPDNFVPMDGTIPVPNHGFIDIAAFNDESWVLNADGTVTGWDTERQHLQPGPVPNGGTVSITGAANSGAAVLHDGRVRMWGKVSAELVNGPAHNYDITDVAVDGGPNESGIALHSNGTISAWGDSEHVPTSTEPFIAIDSGGVGHLALDAAGQVYQFRRIDYTVPDMGNGPGNRVVAISAGGSHNLALQEDGDVIAWGSNSQGQLDVPAFPLPVIAISAGGVHSVAVLDDGSIVGWGDNRYGQAESQPPGSGSDIIAAGYWHTVALTPSRTLIGWGDNDDGQLDNPYPGWTFTALRAGNGTTMALNDQALLLVLGDNRLGLVDYPTPDAEILSFHTTGYHAAMVLARPNPTGIDGAIAPSRMVRILGARPNPFNPTTEIEFTVPAGQPMVLKAFDIRGRLVDALFEGVGTGSRQHFIWRPEALSSGVYFLRVESGDEADVIKTMLLK